MAPEGGFLSFFIVSWENKIDRFDSTELYGNSPLLLQTVYNPKNSTEASSAFSSGTHAQKLEVVLACALELQK